MKQLICSEDDLPRELTPEEREEYRREANEEAYNREQQREWVRNQSKHVLDPNREWPEENETFSCYKCEEAVALEEKYNKDHDICRECVGDLHKEFERCLSDASKSRDRNEHDGLLNESQSIKAHIQAITGVLPSTDYGDYERLVIRP